MRSQELGQGRYSHATTLGLGRKLGVFLKDGFEGNDCNIINEQLERIPEMVPHTACNESDGVTHIGDLLHFDTQSQKRIMGPRYAAAMKRLLAEQGGA